MPETKENVAVRATAADEATQDNVQPKKVIRRGVSTARGTTRLKFTHEISKQNGLFIAHLDSVTLSTVKIGEDTTGMPSFNGLEIPRIVLTFASNEEEVAKRHYVNLSFNAVESNVNTIPGGKEEWKVNAVFDWFKHILDVYYLKGREMTDEEAAALSLPFEDFDEQGEYVSVEPEDVVAGWKVLFENFENLVNRGRDGQPVYKTANNKNIAVWIKLIRYIKNNKKGWQPVNNGELAFPTFVGEGCVELFKANVLPSIRLDAVKECIIPMNIEKPKAPNMPVPGMGMGSAPAMGGVPLGGPTAGGMVDANSFGGIAEAAAEDMPF